MDDRPDIASEPVATLDHLTGGAEGIQSTLHGETLDVYLHANKRIHITPARSGSEGGQEIARLHLAAGSYEIEARGNHPLWVNGKPVSSHLLRTADVIEFGDKGPISRYCLCGEEGKPRKVVSEILSEAVAYLRTSRQPVLTRVCRVLMSVLRRFAGQTTLLFRLGVIAALSSLGLLVYQQYKINVMLRSDLARERANIEKFSESLAQAREQALTPQDLTILRDQIDETLTANVSRLEVLEKSRKASARAIAAGAPSVMFLQGAYAFRETSTGRYLRYVAGPGGQPLVDARGKPRLTLQGEGVIAEKRYTGTGFVLAKGRKIVTNRHVALPWESDANLTAFGGRGLQPELTRFVAYIPGRTEALPVELVRASDDADVAVLAFKGASPAVPGLELSSVTLAPGNRVIVLGYPTGLRAMLAQAGKSFVMKIREAGETNFWKVAERLSENSFIQPLASQGIVAKVTAATIVYDADTAKGGSGGPVLDSNGLVVGVNAAILPEYGGSNIGVPLEKLRQLLDLIEAGKTASTE
ncbi:MAG: trypsin-like peptidase domain-containing protein [Anderseniella sp.]